MKVEALVRAVLKITYDDRGDFVKVCSFLLFCNKNDISSEEVMDYRQTMSEELFAKCEKIYHLGHQYPGFFGTDRLDKIFDDFGVNRRASPNLWSQLTGSAQKQDFEHYINPLQIKSKFIILRSEYLPILVIMPIAFIILFVAGLGDGINLLYQVPVIAFFAFIVSLFCYYLNSGGIRVGETDFVAILEGLDNSTSRLRNTLLKFYMLNGVISFADLTRIYTSIKNELDDLNEVREYLRGDFPVDIKQEKSELNDLEAKVMLDMHHMERLIEQYTDK